MLRGSRGIETLPVVLLLGLALAACTLGLGTKCLANMQRLNERQRAIESFNTFVGRAGAVSAGGLGSVQQVELELGGGKIVVENELVQLWSDGQVLRSEILQLPIHSSNGELRSGAYEIELRRGVQGYFLEVRRL